MSKDNSASGFILVAISAVTFGMLGMFTKAAYANGLDIPSALAWRFIVSAAILVCVGVARNEWKLPPAKALVAFLMGAIGYGGQGALFFIAIYRLNSGLANLLLYTYPCLVTLIEWSVLHRRLATRQAVALVLGLVGCLFTLNPGGGAVDLIGAACGIGAAAWYSVYLILGERLVKGLNPLVVTTYVCVGASVAFFAASLKNGLVFPTGFSGWQAVLGLSVIGTVIPIATMLAGIRRVGAVQASILSTMEPVVTVSLGFLVLGEVLSFSQTLGMGLILFSILWLQLPKGIGLSSLGRRASARSLDLRLSAPKA